MNKERDEIMPPVSSEGKQYLLYNKAVFSGAGYFKHILTTIFILLLIRDFSILFLIYFAWKQKRKTLSRSINSSYQPFVSVVIAAYNEEKVIAKTIHSILIVIIENLKLLLWMTDRQMVRQK